MTQAIVDGAVWMAIWAAMSTVLPIAAGRYTTVPLAVAVFVAVGAINPPASLAWWGSSAALTVSAAVFALGVVSDRAGRPPLFKMIERVVGVPLYLAALVTAGMAAALRAGVSAHLISQQGDASRWTDTHNFAGVDIAVLVAITLATVPMMAVGWVLRHGPIGRLPFRHVMSTAYTFVALVGSLLVGQLPPGLQAAIVLAVIIVGVGGVWALVGRIRWLVSWFRSGNASWARRMAVAAELALPGAGLISSGRRVRGGVRLFGALFIIAAMPLLGVSAMPLYLLLGSAGAIAVARAYERSQAFRSAESADSWGVSDDNDDW